MGGSFGIFGINNVLCESNENGGKNSVDMMGSSATCSLRPCVVLSGEIPYNDVKDLIGNYAQY